MTETNTVLIANEDALIDAGFKKRYRISDMICISYFDYFS